MMQLISWVKHSLLNKSYGSDFNDFMFEPTKVSQDEFSKNYLSNVLFSATFYVTAESPTNIIEGKVIAPTVTW